MIALTDFSIVLFKVIFMVHKLGIDFHLISRRELQLGSPALAIKFI